MRGQRSVKDLNISPLLAFYSGPDHRYETLLADDHLMRCKSSTWQKGKTSIVLGLDNRPLGLEPPNLTDARCDHSADDPLTTRTLSDNFIPLDAIGRVVPHHQHTSYVILFVRFLSVTLGIEKYAEDRRSNCCRPLLEPSQSGSSDGL